MTNTLIEILPENIDVILDLRYFSENNIFKKKIYSSKQNFLQIKAYNSLQKAVKYANRLGYKLKIFDAFRPIEVQKFMYNFFIDTPEYRDFFSNPLTGSVPHCRGVAVDLTLCDFNNQEIDMGSDFDELSDLAYHNSSKISQIQLNNRSILLGIMTYAGFDFYDKEWWHYQLFGARDYPIIIGYTKSHL